MKKLKDCKDFGELYKAIGDKNFGNVACGLTILLICTPLFAGIMNWIMLHASYYYYDAYEYNYRCMALWNVIFTLMLFWLGVFILGKIKSNDWGIKSLISEIKRKQAWILWWLALIFWSIIPVIFSVDTEGAVWGISQLASGYVSHYYMLGVLGCVYLITDKEQKEKVIWAFIGITDILSLIMLDYEYDIPVIGSFSAAPGVSVYTNSNHFGYVITMACLAAVGMYYKCLFDDKTEKRTKKTMICIISIIVQVFAIIVNDTLGSYMAIAITVFFLPILWWFRTRKLNIACIVPLIIIILFTLASYYGFIGSKLGSTIGQSLVVFFKDLFKVSHKSEGYRQAGTSRIGLWIDTIKRIAERPIVGYGPDVLVDRYGNYILENTPHNEFLECAFFLGVPGLVLYLGGLIHLFITKIKMIKTLSLNELIAGGVIIAYMISAFFGVRKYNTVCYMFMFIGLLVGRDTFGKEKVNMKISTNLKKS